MNRPCLPQCMNVQRIDNVAAGTLVVMAPKYAFLNGGLAGMLQLHYGTVRQVILSSTAQELHEFCNC